MFNLSTRHKPILKWAGGKSALLPQLIPYFPTEFKTYIEPFFGGGAVFFSLEHNNAILNDLNSELTECYEAVRDYPLELMKQLEAFKNLYCEEYYYELRNQKLENFIERAARTIFLNKTGFNGLYRQNSKGGFNVPFGKRASCPSLFDKENFLLVSKKLSNTRFLNSDFELAISQAQKGDFIYCDPPYEPLNKTSSFNSYCKNGFSMQDQKRLKEACKNAVSNGAFVAISNSTALPILELYQEETIYKIEANRAINSKGNARGKIDEVLIIMKPI